MAVAPFKPSKEQVAAAVGATLRDVIAADLRILFVGINPSCYSAAVGHHFARPGNRFWPALHGAGLTERLLSPFEDGELPERGLGITNVVARATAAAAELQDEELRAGAAHLTAKVARFRPRIVAVLGVGAFRTGFAQPRAELGEQPARWSGARWWVLPNPSGLNASYQLPRLVELFGNVADASRA